MVSTGISVPHRPPTWRLTLILVVLAGLGLWFVNTSVLHYLQYDATAYGDFWPRRYGLLLHIAGGLLAVSVGLVQIWLGLTGRTRMLPLAIIVSVPWIDTGTHGAPASIAR